MRLLGFIMGIALMGGAGAWYIQAEEPKAWQQLTQELPRKWMNSLHAHFKAPDNLSRKQERGEPKQENIATQEETTPTKSADTLALPASPQSKPLPEMAISPPLTIPEPTEHSVSKEKTEAAPSWQVFWKPFRNELSAQGFAQRVSEITGLDIEVAKKPSNKYLIQFPYSDEAERQHHIELIEDRTGLKLKFVNPQ